MQIPASTLTHLQFAEPANSSSLFWCFLLQPSMTVEEVQCMWADHWWWRPPGSLKRSQTVTLLRWEALYVGRGIHQSLLCGWKKIHMTFWASVWQNYDDHLLFAEQCLVWDNKGVTFIMWFEFISRERLWLPSLPPDAAAALSHSILLCLGRFLERAKWAVSIMFQWFGQLRNIVVMEQYFQGTPGGKPDAVCNNHVTWEKTCFPERQ